jgi:hypothetical protein
MARREKDMKNYMKIFLTGQAAVLTFAVGLVATATLTAPATGYAAGEDGPPPFVFSDRCVPYQLTDEQMLLNGIDPTRIIGGAGPGAGGPPGGGGPGGGNLQDLDGAGNPVPCDAFHTEWRRGTYEACHFYDGSPCYFTVNGQLDQDSFTDDAAGRRAFEIGEHFVIYEMVQNGPPEIPNNPFPFGDPPIDPFYTNPFFGGFAVGTQTKIINAGANYWEDNPTGIWKIGFVRFTALAFNAIQDPGTYLDEHAFLVDMATTNGVNSQGAVNGGLPLIVKGDEIFALVERGLASLRYRIGADGQPGASEGPRYLLCPVHKDPAILGSIVAGEDIIQKWPTVLEFQVPCTFAYSPNAVSPDDPLGRGHNKVCVANLFGPTPPPNEQCLYDHFDCLQRTGDWCGGDFKSGPDQCPPPPFAYD